MVWKGKDGVGTLRRSGRFVAGCQHVTRSVVSHSKLRSNSARWVGSCTESRLWKAALGHGGLSMHGNVTATKPGGDDERKENMKIAAGRPLTASESLK